MTTSTSITYAKKEALKYVFYIQYQVQSKKEANETKVQALIHSESEDNTIYSNFVKELGLSIRPIKVEVKKIDHTMLNTDDMVVTAFLVTDKAKLRKILWKDLFSS